jgi:prepilin-type N-terminal cleavage/methylation domain-containing protein/prepilin-type processing-associated H-X9-DG protein
MRRRRAAFTLIELLVVMSVISILIGLLLPAVQKVRERAALTQGLNNLKQIITAVHMHNDTYQALPTNGLATNPIFPDPTISGPKQPGPWTWQILPFLEQQNIVEGALAAPTNGASYAYKVKTYLCPSRNRFPVSGQSASPFCTPPTAHANWWPTDYAMNLAAFPGVVQNSAPWIAQVPTGLAPVTAQLNLNAISDGTSNTIWGGEKSLNPSRYQCTDFSWDEAAFYGGYGGTARTGNKIENDQRAPSGGDNNWGSPFSNGAPFAFYDGHCKVFNFDNSGILSPYLTANGGEIVTDE